MSTCMAQELSGQTLGETITFTTRAKYGSKMTVTAELRQVYHTAAETVVDVTPHDKDNEGGDLDEFILEPTALVEIHP